MITLNKYDFDCVADVAQHCDNDKLCISVNHSLQFDLSQLYCSFWIDVKEIWEEIIAYELAVIACDANPDCTTQPTEPTDYELKRNLIYGGEYLNCSNRTIQHQGVKTVLAYYSYSRYVVNNQVSDTASGLVKKSNDFSINLDIKELTMRADNYRNMGNISFTETLHFLCANKDTFTWFDGKDCGYCGCGSEKCSGTKAKGYGIRGSNIKKKI